MPLRSLIRCLAALAAIGVTTAGRAYEAGYAGGGSWKVVLISGDTSIPVFDNAVYQVAQRLRARAGVGGRDVQRLSTNPFVAALPGMRLATLDATLGAIRAMRPGPGQGCFVYMTSHGGPEQGIVLAAQRTAIGPAALDAALSAGCGTAPTVAVISGCFTGIFARPPMTRPNRVILTAARPDRTSFGCGAGFTYTVYDECLLRAMDSGGPVQRSYALIQACVVAEEQRQGATPSGPQAYIGPSLGGLVLPGAVQAPTPAMAR